MSASWKLTLPCTRAEAEAIELESEALADLDPPPALLTREVTPDDPEDWALDVYFAAKPDPATIAAIRALVPSAGRITAKPSAIPDQDWVTASQAGLEPIHVGRFFVHTGAHGQAAPPGARAFRIEASRAFGTGHHETTTGCLMMLDAIKRGGARIDNLIDIGTGTGLLAFAGLHLWPGARATATDIDPVAVEVALENAAVNGVRIGPRHGHVALAVADGTDAAMVRRRAPYDLVVANILAQPLIELAPAIAAIAAPAARIVLAGLLTTQADAVARAYRRQGCHVAGRIVRGDWTILRLRRRGR